MKQTAEVIKINGGFATVNIKRVSACGENCKSCEGCASTSLNAEVINTIGAKAGDRVVIESSSRYIIAASFFTYIMPIIIFFILYGILKSEGLVLCIISVVLYLAVLRLLNRFTKAKFTAKISKIIEM